MLFSTCQSNADRRCFREISMKTETENIKPKVSDADYAQLLNSENLIFYFIRNDEHLSFEIISKNVENYLQYNQEDMLNGLINFKDIIYEYDLLQYEREIGEASSKLDKLINHQSFRLVKNNGEIIWVNDTCSKKINDDGELVGFYGYFIDVTRIKDSEAKLAQAYNDMEWKSWELETAKKELELEVRKRVTSEKRALENEEVFRRIFEDSTDPVLLLQGTIFYDCNPSAYRFLEYETREGLIGKTPWDLSPEFQPDGKPSIEKAPEMIAIADENGYYKFEWTHKKSNGKSIIVEVMLTKIFINEEKVFHIAWRDLTERIEADNQLRESEKRFRLLADNMLDMVALHLPDGRYTYISPSVEKLIGYSPNELLGKSPYELFHPEDIERIIKESHELALVGEEIIYIQYRIRTKSGNYVWFETNTNPILDEMGEVVQLQTVSRNITDRKEVLERIKTLSDEYEVVFDGTQDSLFLIEVLERGEYRYIRNNKTHQKQTGLHLDSLRGSSPIDLIGEKLGKQIIKNYNLCYDAKGPIQYEEELDLPAGRRYWSTTLTPIISEDKISFIIGSSQDITHRKEYEDQLKKLLEEVQVSKDTLEVALSQKNNLIEELEHTRNNLEVINKEKDKFFSIIAHDLKNPFSGFLGLTQIMSEQLMNLSMKELMDYSKSLQESASNLYKLLENLLEWTRMQRGAVSFNPDFCALHLVVKQNINIIAERAKQKNINITTNVPEDLSCFADIQMLDTVFRNLISNAVKFTNSGGKVEISASKLDVQTIQVAIKDNGIGMNKSLQEKLFRIDQKTNRLGTDGESSTGLGLLLCKEFIEKNGGTIRVESEDGIGSTFYFTLKNAENDATMGED